MKSYYVIGVMSGTSLDGLDLVYAKFEYNNLWKFTILDSDTINYNKYWVEKLKNLIDYSEKELASIDIEYTALLAKEIKAFITKYKIEKIDAVCSHGHTALHLPEKSITYQIGNRKELAKLINQVVICDFRVQDISLGGQGAPLVPIGDQLLFSKHDFCLNIGGFANISLEENKERIAYDICPANIVLNAYVRKLGLDYDSEGKVSETGTIDLKLLEELNKLIFYFHTPPKSLGLEWVNENIFPLIDNSNITTEDILRTFVEHIAIQIAKEVNKKENASVLVSGGGVYNSFLIERIKKHTFNRIDIPSKDIIEYKEALIFGLLGILKLRGEANCLKSVTGAKQDHSSGVVFHP